MTPFRSSIARVLALSVATLVVACGSSQSPGTNSGAENKTSGVDVSGFQAPDASMTPGKVLTRDISVISAPGYTASVRDVPESEKKAVAAAYNYTGPDSGVEYDHLVSLELGGSNDAKNIWPQPIAEARVKDQLEDYLHRQVVAGKMSLPDAQNGIANDWKGLYDKTLGPNAPSTEGDLAGGDDSSTSLGTDVGDACNGSTGCDPDEGLYCQATDSAGNGSCATCDSFGPTPAACADGTTPTYVPSFDGTTCDTTACVDPCSAASDCQGILPQTSEVCDDGTTQVAHWDCVDSGCQMTICDDNGGITAN